MLVLDSNKLRVDHHLLVRNPPSPLTYCLGTRDLYTCYAQSRPLGIAGVGTATSVAGGVTNASSVSAATTAMPGGSGQTGPGQPGKELFEPLELNYLQLLGQEVCTVLCNVVK